MEVVSNACACVEGVRGVDGEGVRGVDEEGVSGRSGGK